MYNNLKELFKSIINQINLMKQNKAIAISVVIAAVFGLTLFNQFIWSFFGQGPADQSGLVSDSVAGDIGKTEIIDLVVGSGKEVVSGSIVTLHYIGKLENGQIFDSSKQAGNPFSFKVGQGLVIKGFDRGLVGMKVGGTRKIIIPPNEGYGDKTVGPIPANATLTLEVELLEVK